MELPWSCATCPAGLFVLGVVTVVLDVVQRGQRGFVNESSLPGHLTDLLTFWAELKDPRDDLRSADKET